MINPKGALTIAEGRFNYRTDVSLVLNNGVEKKDFVLRTCLDSYDVWKARYGKGGSPFKAFIKGNQKQTAIVDREVWVFGVDATNRDDIFVAVKIGMSYFKVNAEDIIGDVYVKNLNIENEGKINPALVQANKNLYAKVTQAIIGAAQLLGCSNKLQFWVYSSNINPKIPRSDLHEALLEGGASEVITSNTQHLINSGSNAGGPGPKFKTNLHLARLDI